MDDFLSSRQCQAKGSAMVHIRMYENMMSLATAAMQIAATLQCVMTIDDLMR
jgi:hypothetical protein